MRIRILDDMKWAVILVTAAVSLASVEACDSGWENFADSGPDVCLYFVRSKATWQNMRTLCRELASGADLAILKGDLHQKVVQYINDAPDGDLDDEAFWIGGSDAAHEGSWIWVPDSSEIPLGTPHWYPCNGQPNGGTDQNFLSLYTPDFYFHSLEGSRQIFGICMI